MRMMEKIKIKKSQKQKNSISTSNRCASITDLQNVYMEWQEKPKIKRGTFVNMTSHQFAWNSNYLKTIEKKDVRTKIVKKCITMFANTTKIAKTEKIADFTTQRESKQYKGKEPTKSAFKLEKKTDRYNQKTDHINILIVKVMKMWIF